MLSGLPHLAGQIYKYLIEGFKGTTFGLKDVWERDLTVTYEDDEWNKLVKEMLNHKRDARSKPFQFKILNRLYWTPVKKNRAGLRPSNNRRRCQRDQGNMVHIFLIA